MRFSKYLILIILSVVIQTGLMAGTTGKIAGQVNEAGTQEPLIGLNIIIQDSDLGTASDFDGYYQILNVPPGTYTVRFLMIGYRETIVNDVQVSSDHTTNVDIELEQMAIEGDAITVTAVRPIIEMDRTSTESSVSADQIETMPVESVGDILNLQAGVVDGHFRGGRLKEVTYQIDGVPINDAFSGQASLEIENDVIQELKVISGTFNAEYGQAQSGVVDIITKGRSPKLTGRVGMSSGDYISTKKDLFWNIDNISPTDYFDYNLYLSGPLGDKSGYLFSMKQVNDEGYLYGENVYLPVDGEELGNNSYVPMGYNNRLSIFSKVTYGLTNSDKISTSLSYQARDQNRDFGIYDHLFRYNPNGQGESHEKTLIAIFGWNHLLSEKSFFSIKSSLNRKDFERYTFEDPLDPNYTLDTRLRGVGNFSFYTGGTDNAYFTRGSDTYSFLGDITSQITRNQSFKAGFDIKSYNLTLYDVKLKKNAETGFKVEIPPVDSPDNQQYEQTPLSASVFAQTKWEYDSFILNFGLRYDYFDASGDVLTDFTRPRTAEKISSEPSHQLSPRIGIAYPITERGVMHVSYGHFFQTPEFEFLYVNPNFTVNPEDGLASVFNYPFGNADLKPQKTVAYEIGLQQQLGLIYGLDITAYYKDIRNLLGTEINTIATGEEHSGIQYGRYINRDYGQVKGLTFMFERRMSDGFSASIDYTYQVSRGNASDPKSVLIDLQSDPPVESEKQLIPLDWDRTHSLNGQLATTLPASILFSIIGKYGSGTPYTPSVAKTTSVFQNSDRKPTQITFDTYLMREVNIGPTSIKLSLKIYNLFDRGNERDVYGDSGRASYTSKLKEPGLAQGLNSKEEFFTRPDWFGSPRRIIFGISTSF